jgi:hypothetical protein
MKSKLKPAYDSPDMGVRDDSGGVEHSDADRRGDDVEDDDDVKAVLSLRNDFFGLRKLPAMVDGS